MKKEIGIIVLAGALLVGCNKDHSNGAGWVNEATRAAFTTQYPSAKNVEWEKRSNYIVAEFKQNNVESEAWYDANGVWYMTETDISFNNLPAVVQTAYKQSEYKAWTVDDVDMIERKNMETVYIIEAEQGDMDVDLYFSPDGILVKSVIDADTDNDHGDFIPVQPSGTVEEYIKNTYPNARIIEIDNEKGITEVDILDGQVKRELLFGADGTWMQTKTDIHPSQLPATVITAIKGSAYASYMIDDAEFIQTPSAEWYLVDLESGKQEVKLKITPEGVIL